MDLRQAIERYHAALDEFSRGSPEPIKKLVSRGNDVILANPFGPAIRGWPRVSEALDFASSNFRDGKFTGFETIAEYVSTDLAIIFEVERWTTRFSGEENLSDFALRVSTTFRHEDGEWKMVHRHADPINSFSARGPLRNASA